MEDLKLIKYLEDLYLFHEIGSPVDQYKPYLDLKGKKIGRVLQIIKSPANTYIDLAEEHQGANKIKKWNQYFNHYFNETFDSMYFRKYLPSSPRYPIIILPSATTSKIREYINKYNLNDISEFIFEMIAVSQAYYLQISIPLNDPKYKKLIKSTPQDIEETKKLLSKSFPDDNTKIYNDTSANLPDSVLFKFFDKTFKIENPMLIHDLLLLIKKEYDNTKDGFDILSHGLSPNSMLGTIEKKLVAGLYKFLTEEKFFKLDSSKTPNKLMECLIEFFEFTLIPIGKEQTSMSDKIKIVRNWINRN